MPKKTALIAGATGLTGSTLLKILTASDVYEKISLVSRKMLSVQHTKTEEVLVDFDKLEDFANRLHADDVFCCLGTTIKKAGSKEILKKVDYEYPLQLAKITKGNGAKRFLLVSAMGASEKSPFFYSRVKGALEKSLSDLGFDALHIFRPSLLLGKRNEFRFGEQVAVILFKMLSWAFVGPLRKYKGIKAETVANAMFIAAQKDGQGVKIWESDMINTNKPAN